MVPYVEDLGDDILLKLIQESDVHPNKASHVGVQGQAWLNHVPSINKNKVDDEWQLTEVPVVFSGFFSKHQDQQDVKPRAVIGKFPVFGEKKADTIRMQKHDMLVVKKVSVFVNPGQIPVLEGGWPLYAHQKRCQMLFPEEVGEQHMVFMIGFLHMKMCTQKAGVKLLGGSGWEQSFHLEKIFTPGVAASLLGGKYIKRTRHAYLLTLSCLEILRRDAYDKYCL